MRLFIVLMHTYRWTWEQKRSTASAENLTSWPSSHERTPIFVCRICSKCPVSVAQTFASSKSFFWRSIHAIGRWRLSHHLSPRGHRQDNLWRWRWWCRGFWLHVGCEAEVADAHTLLWVVEAWRCGVAAIHHGGVALTRCCRWSGYGCPDGVCGGRSWTWQWSGGSWCIGWDWWTMPDVPLTYTWVRGVGSPKCL